MGELQFHNRGGCVVRGSGSVRMERRLTLMEGRLLSSCLFIESSITDSICLSDVGRLRPHPSSPSIPPFASNCWSILREEGRETMESLRLEVDRDEAWSLVAVWLSSCCLRMFAIILLSDSLFYWLYCWLPEKSRKKKQGEYRSIRLIEGSDDQVLSKVVSVDGLVEVFLALTQTSLDGLGRYLFQTALSTRLQFLTVVVGGAGDGLLESGHEPLDGVELVRVGWLEVEPDPVFSQ